MSKPLNYARWDNIDVDTDSDDDAPRAPSPAPVPTAATTGNRAASAASASSSTQAQPTPHETAQTVQAIKIYCELDKRRHPGAPWVPVTIPATHPVFSEPALPVSRRLDLPLAMWREGTKSADRADLDCQMATYLAIDDRTAFAPPRWQAYVGTVIVARLDRKPLSSQHLEGFWMYNDAILDAMGDSHTGVINERRWLGRPQFERWWRNYVKERHEGSAEFLRLNGMPAPEPGSADDFSNPGSPYEV
ncbi:hypothetical protein AURDEDRAFT_116757 [Auricularia subglabra TFB-10046 SS5]|uniref:Uncharacterized protein n=1 Tax=Auricularia subglabra (strain TFB-10046 / SS5) TaxID=717982 RepID=J0LHF2_AURST|nr:hypothetical protein AURDEDRAFT_116757 [Auricularia subglabra TFB-10046 SS5]